MGDGFDWDQQVGANVATTEPRTISADRSLGEALAAFQRHGYRTLPVTDGDEVLGLIRLGDVLKHLAEAFPEELLNLPPRPHQVMEKPEGG
jgi:CBS domain-containing protein